MTSLPWMFACRISAREGIGIYPEGKENIPEIEK
jgi:hypothetical protein